VKNIEILKKIKKIKDKKKFELGAKILLLL